MEYALLLGSALWLGILTSISPCPLATNIAAITFVSRQVSSRGTARVFGAGIGYTAGRALVYMTLGVVIVAGALSVPGLSFFLQKYINMALGPLLILTGMFLLQLISLNLGTGNTVAALQKRVSVSGVPGSFLLGVVFALAFCPVSAALFFGSLIPLAIKGESHLLIPGIYGAGTALPVLVFALLIAFGVRSLSSMFGAVTRIEGWARRITGVVFIIVGIYLTLKYVFQMA